MNNRWTLHIQNFGKINAANITLSSVTLFVGDNNSGKSYLMALLYALLNMRFHRKRYDFCEESPEYATCSAWVRDAFVFGAERQNTIQMTEEIQKVFGQLLNRILMNNRKKLSLDAFNDEVPIGEISISLPVHENLFFTASHKERNEGDGETEFYRLQVQNNYIAARSLTLDCKFFIGYILEYLLKADYKKHRALRDCVFLPTSRTGFLLTYKSLVRASIADAYDSDLADSAMSLTRPCSDFLKNLSSIDPSRVSNRYNDIIEYLENKLMCGRLYVTDNTPQSTIKYRPNQSDQELPMHLSSGVVTELAPLMIMLKYHTPIETLFIEEPEMGLHPALQLEMAKVLIKVHSKNIPLFVTTHSDIILQHINNMIKLNSQDDRMKQRLMEQYGYTHDDIIAGADIAMYQFDVDNDAGKSNVRELSCDKYGFIVPTFNNTLKDLLTESRHMEEDSNDAHV